LPPGTFQGAERLSEESLISLSCHPSVGWDPGAGRWAGILSLIIVCNLEIVIVVIIHPYYSSEYGAIIPGKDIFLSKIRLDPES
jgi:hypothetical protein